jgi:hypothetical protein
MTTSLIEIRDGIRVEAEVQESEFKPIASGIVRKEIGKSFDQIIPILHSVSSSIASAWQEMNQDVIVDQAEVQINFSFEGKGNLYVTQAKAGANLSVKLIFKPK